MWKNGENVLVVNKNLNSKEIHGKKYRSPAFIMSAIFSIRRLTALQVAHARQSEVRARQRKKPTLSHREGEIRSAFDIRK